MVFQEELAVHESRVKTLGQVRACGDRRAAFVDAWDEILLINYLPIFRVAREVLVALPSSGGMNDALGEMAKQAGEIVSKRGALRHDLMGRVYHRLLHEAKYLGTYYTSVPAATLLVKVALQPEKWPGVDWAEIPSIADLRVVDPACGTGTLLMAAVQAATDNYVRASAAGGQPVDLRALHQALVESTLWGFDVLTSAIHLTASTLALLAPAVSFRHMNLQVVPLGGANSALGSVEFLVGRVINVQQNLFGPTAEATHVTGVAETAVVAEIPEIDLCVMNPPFTRSVGGSLLFGSRPEPERHAMQSRLRNMLSGSTVQASSTAGLAPVFIAVGDAFLKVGGRQALVTPRALVSGVAWGETRSLLTSRYAVEHVMSSHDPSRWNFSENTSLSETLLIAKRTDERPLTTRTTWVSLWRNPRTMVEATSLADAIATVAPAPLEGAGVQRLNPDGADWGEVFSIPNSWLGEDLWIYHAFAQTELVRIADRLLRNGEVAAPGGTSKVPLIKLSAVGAIGPDRRDIHDGFTVGTTPTQYGARWGHDSSTSRTLALEVDRYLIPRSTPAAGRPSRPVRLLWPRAGRLLIAERLRLNTHRIAAGLLPVPVLSNVWWPVRIEGEDAEVVAKVLALWLNSTLGLLSLLARREETEGAWIAFKKPVLEATPVLDVRALPSKAVGALAADFDRLCKVQLSSISAVASDFGRAAIDASFTRALGLPVLDPIRDMLGREPVVTLAPLGEEGSNAGGREDGSL
jgi:hypothetical protein